MLSHASWLLQLSTKPPPVSLQQHRGAQVLVAVPPVGGAAGGAARAQDALVQAVQLGTRLAALVVLHLLALGPPAAIVRSKSQGPAGRESRRWCVSTACLAGREAHASLLWLWADQLPCCSARCRPSSACSHDRCSMCSDARVVDLAAVLGTPKEGARAGGHGHKV